MKFFCSKERSPNIPKTESQFQVPIFRQLDQSKAKDGTDTQANPCILIHIEKNGAVLVHKGSTNLGPLEVSVRDLVQKKQNFLFFVYLNSPHDFLSMIFGILGKFQIDIEKNPSKKIKTNIFFRKSRGNIFRDQKNFEKKNR